MSCLCSRAAPRAPLLATVLAAALAAAPAFGAAAAAPATAAPAAPAAAPALTGQVLEVLQAGAYTYLRLKTPAGETWAAVPAANLAKGASVTIANPMVMEKLESKTLKRSFDKIVFGTLAEPGGGGGAAAAPGGMAGTGGAGGMSAMSGMGAMGGMGPGHGGPPAAAAPPPAVKVPKAEGPEGRTVAEVNGTRTKLKDKTVVVRGQVVKVSLGIMGKNWVHLRDGSGNAADGSNDLLVTTQDKAAVGDIVAARGTVRTGVDLGSGYRYEVLIEGAALKK